MIFAGTSRSPYRLLNILHDLAFSLLSIRRISKILSNRLFNKAWTGWNSEFLSDWLFDSALPRIVFESIFSILVDWLLDIFLNVFSLVIFFILCFLQFSLSKIRRFCNIFIEELFKFVFCLTWYSLCQIRLLLYKLLIGVSKWNTFLRFRPFFHYRWKYGVLIIKRKIKVIGGLADF